MKTIYSIGPTGEESVNTPPIHLLDLQPVRRSFFPGQEWLYLKVYLSTPAADTILINIIRPLDRKMTEEGWSLCLFFVRYEDPDNHLRIRLRTTQNQFHSLLKWCQKALEPFIKSGLIYRVQLDTYQRELGRYGSARIKDCEAIFGADSRMVLDWLSLKDQQEADRMQFALLSADILLTDFGFTLPEKLTVCRSLKQLFFQGERAIKELKRNLNDLYRKHHGFFLSVEQENLALVQARSKAI